jgi:hypothetical protein
MGYGQYSIYGAHKRSNPLSGESKPKRQVFPTSEIPHLWAHQTQPNARNPQGNLYFRGPVIYSYRDSAPLARIIEFKGKKAVLFNTAKWSVTTSGQQSDVRRSIPKDMSVFEVPHLGLNRYSSDPEPGLSKSVHDANLQYFVNESKSEFDKANRARSTAQYLLRSAFEFSEAASDYAKFFRLRVPKFSFLPHGQKLQDLQKEFIERKRKSDESTARAQTTRRANRDREWAERSERWKQEQAERERIQALALPERIAEWRNGGPLSYGFPSSVPCMLRIKREEIETSLGARVPLDHARRALRLVRAVRSSGREYVRNGHTVRVGHYPIDRIATDGTLFAGCHVIGWEEIERISPDLDGRVDQSEVILSDVGPAVGPVGPAGQLEPSGA